MIKCLSVIYEFIYKPAYDVVSVKDTILLRKINKTSFIKQKEKTW